MPEADISYLSGKYVAITLINCAVVLLLITNINEGNIYCDLSGKIFNILNKFL